MKKFFIAMLAVLFVAGAAYAAAPEVDFSGMIYTRGSYISNSDGLSNDSGDYMYYDMEFDADLKIKPNDKSFVFLNWEIHDEDFGDTPYDSQNPDPKQGDDNIMFKRAYGSYTFDFGTQVDFGLMTGGAWGTGFGDTGGGRYRLKFMHPTGMGPLFFILEKNGEEGSGATGDYDAEADDSDAYYVAMVTKVGDINIKPLLGYIVVGEIRADTPGGLVELDADNEKADATAILLDLAVDGSFGSLGFEAEFVYLDYSFDVDGPEDHSRIGAYVNVWANLDALKVGGLVAYGSWDEDAGKGFGFGEDFCPTIFGADWTPIGSSNDATDPLYGAKSEYNAVTLAQIYVGYALSETINLDAAFAYWMSNETETAWEDSTGMELDAWLGVKLADNVKYDVGLAYGQINLDKDAYGYDDADAFTRFYHVIKVAF